MGATRRFAILFASLSAAIPSRAQTTTYLASGLPWGADNAVAISGDGLRIAFQSDASVIVGDANGVDDVFIFDLSSGVTERVSVTSSGGEVHGASLHPAMSADARYIAFCSYASDLVAGDTNGLPDVFVHDRQTDSTLRVSVDSAGVQANQHSGLEGLAVSGNGRFVVFASDATNLVPGDSNLNTDVFVRDLQTSQTSCASVTAGGVPGPGDSEEPSISANGRYVAFESAAYNLVSGDTNGCLDIFVRDRQNGMTERVSVDSSGSEANGVSRRASISADGRYVAFLSAASDLVLGDTNGNQDVFVRDRQAGVTIRVSVGSNGIQPNAACFNPMISPNGRFVAFDSNASNLVAGDTNGANDVFAHSLQLNETFLVGVGNSGIQFSLSVGGHLSSDGRFVAFNAGNIAYVRDWWHACYQDADLDGFGSGPILSIAADCGAGTCANDLDCDDSNSAIHPGAPETCNGLDDDCNGSIDDGLTFTTYYADADGDGYGDSSTGTSQCAQPSGYVTDASDCDDANAAVHPGASDICNGVDDDCDGVIDNAFTSTYCTAGTTAHGCVPWIAGEGAPSSTAGSGFDIVVHAVEGLRMGLIYYGSYSAAVPWAIGSPSYRCVANPVQRTPTMSSSGHLGQCDGELRVDFNAWMQANPGGLGYPFVPGQVFYAQGWFRDPSAPKGTNLSDGLRFTLCN